MTIWVVLKTDRKNGGATMLNALLPIVGRTILPAAAAVPAAVPVIAVIGVVTIGIILATKASEICVERSNDHTKVNVKC